jgi:hypothetical protein
MSIISTVDADTNDSMLLDLLRCEWEREDFLNLTDFDAPMVSLENPVDLQSLLGSTEAPFFDIATDARQWMVTDRTSRRLRAPRLYEFLLLLLQKPEYISYASYTDRSKGIFEIHEPDKVASLWQRIRGRQSTQDMTYDKFARAIRWYYPKGIMLKTNARYTFRFSAEILQDSLIDRNNNTLTHSTQMH